MAKNDYILVEMVDSGLYYVDQNGSIWTRKKLGGPGAVYTDRWRRCECYAGNKGRPQIRHNGVLVYASRLVWYWFNGWIDEREVDHNDNNVRNNKITNLQLLTSRANMQKANQDGLCDNARRPSANRKLAMKQWWAKRGRKELMSGAAKRGWIKRKVSATH